MIYARRIGVRRSKKNVLCDNRLYFYKNKGAYPAQSNDLHLPFVMRRLLFVRYYRSEISAFKK
jgi:hypothetical protein